MGVATRPDFILLIFYDTILKRGFGKNIFFCIFDTLEFREDDFNHLIKTLSKSNQHCCENIVIFFPEYDYSWICENLFNIRQLFVKQPPRPASEGFVIYDFLIAKMKTKLLNVVRRFLYTYSKYVLCEKERW